MKLVLMTYYIGRHDEVMEILERLVIRAYTRWREVEGRISRGEPRENSHVWPGANSALMAVLDEDQAARLINEIEAFNGRRDGEGIDAYVLDVARTVTAGEA